ncbi:MAG: hypothetical protein HQM00_05670 [Magnetococcales bacterium]|nr:hypothetical protein [Magnetococcales bacterium]
MGISIRAYARLRGVTEGAVRKAIKTGRISIEPDRTIDSDKADCEWDNNTNQLYNEKYKENIGVSSNNAKQNSSDYSTSESINKSHVRDIGTSENNIPSYQISRAVREAYLAKKARLDYEVRAGKLLSSDEVAKSAFNIARIVRDKILNIPRRYPSLLLSSEILLSEDDCKKVEQILHKELLIVINDLCDYTPTNIRST